MCIELINNIKKLNLSFITSQVKNCFIKFDGELFLHRAHKRYMRRHKLSCLWLISKEKLLIVIQPPGCSVRTEFLLIPRYIVLFSYGHFIYTQMDLKVKRLTILL